MTGLAEAYAQRRYNASASKAAIDEDLRALRLLEQAQHRRPARVALLIGAAIPVLAAVPALNAVFGLTGSNYDLEHTLMVGPALVCLLLFVAALVSYIVLSSRLDRAVSTRSHFVGELLPLLPVDDAVTVELDLVALPHERNRVDPERSVYEDRWLRLRGRLVSGARFEFSRTSRGTLEVASEEDVQNVFVKGRIMHLHLLGMCEDRVRVTAAAGVALRVDESLERQLMSFGGAERVELTASDDELVVIVVRTQDYDPGGLVEAEPDSADAVARLFALLVPSPARSAVDELVHRAS